jgi:sec-independent protein translocase protein TatA
MSVGHMEIIIVLALALLIFGPKRLPEMGRTLGRAAREFRKASDEVKGVLNLDLNVDDDSTAAGAAGPAAVTAAANAAAPLQTPALEPWWNEALATADAPSPATDAAQAPAVPGLAGFLGVTPAGIEPQPSAAGDDGSAAPAFASFLGAGAAADAQPEPPMVAEAPEAPTAAETG